MLSSSSSKVLEQNKTFFSSFKTDLSSQIEEFAVIYREVGLAGQTCLSGIILAGFNATFLMGQSHMCRVILNR